VRQIIEEGGPDRLLVTTTGAPLEANYRALIDAAIEYGRR